MATLAQIAQKFEHFLEVYRRPDGSRWGGQDLHNTTGAVVTRSYVSNLRKGRIENPGFEKLKAIAQAMNFPPEVEFEESVGARPTGTRSRSGSAVRRLDRRRPHKRGLAPPRPDGPDARKVSVIDSY
jgi:transcriptional regulator with XRE-family HTH domain